jgi:phosphate-selective porin OprO/OprP
MFPAAPLLAVLLSPAAARAQDASPPPVQDTKDTKKPKDAKDPKDQKGPKDAKSPKEPKEPKEQKKEEEKYPFFRLDDHPSFHFGKGTHLDLRGRFAADVLDSDAPDPDETETASIDLGKKRLGVSGEIANVIEFQIEAELQKHDPWRDVYAEFKKYDEVRVRGGHFKLPFSLDENTSARVLDFMFRSLAATHLSPGRDTGVMVFGRVVNGVINYEAGVFQHDGKNARTNNPDKVFGDQTIAARVVAEPLRNVKDAKADLSVGAAFTTSDVPEGIPGLRGLMVGEQTFFSANDYPVKGKRRRTGFEMMVAPGPASVKAEWIRVETERLGLSVEDTDLSPIVGQGWYVSGTYAITGEKKSRVERPKKPLFQGGIGAIEVGARVESLEFKSGSGNEPPSNSPRAEVIVGNRNQVVTLGVNWYVNRFVKIQANYFREKLDDPSLGPLPPQGTFSTTAFRFQVSF